MTPDHFYPWVWESAVQAILRAGWCLYWGYKSLLLHKISNWKKKSACITRV